MSGYTRILYDEAGGKQPSVPRSAGISFIETTVVVDGLGELRKVTGHSSGMILVRPDGYVAASTDLTNADAVLAKYLQDYLHLVKPKS